MASVELLSGQVGVCHDEAGSWPCVFALFIEAAVTQPFYGRRRIVSDDIANDSPDAVEAAIHVSYIEPGAAQFSPILGLEAEVRAPLELTWQRTTDKTVTVRIPPRSDCWLELQPARMEGIGTFTIVTTDGTVVTTDGTYHGPAVNLSSLLHLRTAPLTSLRRVST
jgi:hypothetical protein